MLKHPAEHGGGGGFAVGAGDGQHMAAKPWGMQHMVAQPLRAAGVGQTGFQNGFHQRIARCAIGQAGTRHHIANDEHVGLQGQLVGAVALDQFDAQSAQLVAHRGVDAAVAAGDAVTGFPGQGGQAAHEGAADT